MKITRPLILLLSAAMVMSLASCGEKESRKKSRNDDSSVSAGTELHEPASEPEETTTTTTTTAAATHSTPFTGVLAYDGRQLTIGEDDLSELGDLVLRYEYDDGVPILKDGCFCGSHLDPNDHGIDQKTDFYLSADGRKIISEAYEYELVY